MDTGKNFTEITPRGEKRKRKRSVNWRILRPILTFVISGAIAAFLIMSGINNRNESDYIRLDVKTEEELKTEIDKAYEENNKLREERNKLKQDSKEYAEKSAELTKKEAKRADLEAELFKIKNGFYNEMKSDAKKNSLPYIMGGVIVGVTGLFATVMMIITGRKSKAKILSRETVKDNKSEKSDESAEKK